MSARLTARQHVLRALGVAFVGLGFLGVFLPLLPTTPFLLLALACFARSSPAIHDWLINHRMLGPYIRRLGTRPVHTNWSENHFCRDDVGQFCLADTWNKRTRHRDMDDGRNFDMCCSLYCYATNLAPLNRWLNLWPVR